MPDWTSMFGRRHSALNDAGLDFAGALADIERRIRDSTPFALSRFGDGEMKIISGVTTDLLHKGHGEHRYLPGDTDAERRRAQLVDAFRWQAPHYIVAIPCPCCVGSARHHEFRDACGQPPERLTWANVFVNANYAAFRTSTMALLGTRPCNLVCHRDADPASLPFTARRVFTVGADAWVADHDRVLGELLDAIERERISGELFLFSAGVLSNLLIRTLAERYPDNTWLDVGSVLDPELGLGATRKYHRGGRKSRRVCRWG